MFYRKHLALELSGETAPLFAPADSKEPRQVLTQCGSWMYSRPNQGAFKNINAWLHLEPIKLEVGPTHQYFFPILMIY